MSNRWKAGFIQAFFDPLTEGPATPELYSWGYNDFGNLGLGDRINRSSPVQVGSDKNWDYLSQGGRFNAAAIKTDGSLYAWGYNIYGGIGDNTVIDRSSPVQIGSLTTWSKINHGESFAIASKTDGTLWGWGRNENGALGINLTTNDYRSSPVQIGSETDWSEFHVGPDALHVLAIRNGELYAWGWDAFGQLGLGGSSNRSSPVQVGALTNWSIVRTTERASFAIKTDGSLWSWGYNAFGQLGLNDISNRNSPVQIGSLTTWSSIFTGENSAYFIKNDGTLWAVGENSTGMLGLNDAINYSSPVQVGSDTNWSDGTGNRESTIALKTDGTLWSWGDNAFGQLGDDTVAYNVNVSSPIQIGSDTNWVKVGQTASYGFMAAKD